MAERMGIENAERNMREELWMYIMNERLRAKRVEPSSKTRRLLGISMLRCPANHGTEYKPRTAGRTLTFGESSLDSPQDCNLLSDERPKMSDWRRANAGPPSAMPKAAKVDARLADFRGGWSTHPG